jgi:hypothetical protein
VTALFLTILQAAKAKQPDLEPDTSRAACARTTAASWRNELQIVTEVNLRQYEGGKVSDGNE